MSTSNPHTLPWSFTGGALLDCNGQNAATKANGALIAQAVNDRAELLEALRDCADSMHTLIQLHRLKPEENQTLEHARALLA